MMSEARDQSRRPAPATQATLWTLGHSTLALDDFLDLLAGTGLQQLADVRRFPGSRRHPHFNSEALQQALAGRGIGYRHLPELGGRRGKPAPDSPNTGWRVAQFAAYADHMASAEFAAGMAALTEYARTAPTAVMCAEAVPWQCHRRLIADLLTVRGWQVLDLMPQGRVTPHRLTEFARVEGERLVYPPPQPGLPLE